MDIFAILSLCELFRIQVHLLIDNYPNGGGGGGGGGRDDDDDEDDDKIRVYCKVLKIIKTIA